jgi:sulfur carrier protein
MEIYVNGAPQRFEPETTVAGLLERLGYSGRRVAVEINRDIVPRSGFRDHHIQAGDRIEIVQAIGGG